MSAPDPLAALCAYLRVEIGSLLDQIPSGSGLSSAGAPAVFRPDVPKAMDSFMPLRAVAVRGAGGYRRFGGSMLPLSDPRFYFTCFGSSQSQATNIARNVALALKQLSSPQTWEGCVLYSATVEAGPTPLPDEQTLWPTCWVAAEVMHGDYAAPVI